MSKKQNLDKHDLQQIEKNEWATKIMNSVVHSAVNAITALFNAIILPSTSQSCKTDRKPFGTKLRLRRRFFHISLNLFKFDP